MNKKILKVIALSELIISIIMYFLVAYQFDNDILVQKIMPNTDLEATLLRLSIYIIPGINIISGIFKIVFSTKGILCFAAILEILSGILTLHFKGKNDFMNIMGIIIIVLGVISIILSLTLKSTKKTKGDA